MRKSFVILIGSGLFLSFLSCSTTIPTSTKASTNRTIIIDGSTTLSESKSGKFTSWACRDYVGDDTNIKVELGFFVDTLFKGIGFILYDGGNTGESTYYKRTGLVQNLMKVYHLISFKVYHF